MFETILYPTDFSEVSKKTLDYCKKLKDVGTKKIVLLHVIEWDSGAKNLPANFREELEKLLAKEARKEMALLESELKASGFDIKSRIEMGSPLREILKVEEEENVSAIVIGSHGKSNVKEIVMGSVSENVVRKSKKPVLVIKR